MIPAVAPVVTVGFAEACLAGDILLALQNVPLIKQAAHTHEVGLLQTVVTMFYDQEFLAEQFPREIPAISANVSNFTGVR